MFLRRRCVPAGIAAAVLVAMLGASGASRANGGTRTISLHNIHTKETVTVLYKKDGRYLPDGLEKASWVLRDWRRNEATKMDPELIDLLWEMHRELGSKEPIHVISGYRSRSTNDMLRKTVGGQASESRHILGKAADVHFPDIALRQLRYSALVRERGGVGYYPTSAIPFVHVDTDRVRHWPRLPRHELALLFPSGRSQHMPADGGPITSEDVRVAQARHRELAIQLAAFHDTRGRPAPGIAVAALAPKVVPAGAGQRIAALTPAPRLLEPLQPAVLPAVHTGKLVEGPSEADRDQLATLAALAAAPQLVAAPRLARRPPRLASLGAAGRPADVASDAAPVGVESWVVAPAFDEEHPEELTYRPFPVAPLLTASINDPALARLVHPDVARTLELIDQPGATAPLRIRPASQTAALLWASQFTGEAIGLARLLEMQAPDQPPAASTSRRVRLEPR